MLIKYFDNIYYNLDLSKEKVENIIANKSKLSQNVLSSSHSFKVNFYEDKFKMKFLPAINFGGISSISPIFYGKITDNGETSRLKIKMRPNAIVFAVFVVMLYMIIQCCYALIKTGVPLIFIFMMLPIIIFACGIIKHSNTKFDNMKKIMDELFAEYSY